LVLARTEWNVGAPGRESVPRASGPARGTESQGLSFSERFAFKKINAHRLDWLVRTHALPRPEFALGYFGSFLFSVFIPLVWLKNHFIRKFTRKVAVDACMNTLVVKVILELLELSKEVGGMPEEKGARQHRNCASSESNMLFLSRIGKSTKPFNIAAFC